MWFRRDLRLLDNPALLAACQAAIADGDGDVVPLFVVDPVLWEKAGPVRQNYLVASLDALGASLDRSLLIRHGDPAIVVPEVVLASKATSVHIAADFAPYGMRRDANVEMALGDVPLVRTGSPYAVAPGRVTKGDGTAYRVFTPFYRTWMIHGWRAPAADVPQEINWLMPMECQGRPTAPTLSDITLPPAGEQAAWEQWMQYQKRNLSHYSSERDRPDLNTTSKLSHHLRWGEIHPRSLLAELGEEDEVFRKELCWREFYADVLFQAPDSISTSLNAKYDNMDWAKGPESDRAFEAWSLGRTGFPLVDAGMRQLRTEGWIHNRVRMVVASFLIKDLHIQWQRGAAEFMYYLRDGDVASNVHGWQWTAGCGTDASPFYRVFNPISQGLKFDPDGEYVRRYIPELGHLTGAAAHEPWDQPDGYAHGYPERIVDHAAERLVALAAYQEIR